MKSFNRHKSITSVDKCSAEFSKTNERINIMKNKTRKIKHREVPDLIFDDFLDDFSMEKFLEEIKDYKGEPELNFTIVAPKNKGIFKLRTELRATINCTVDEPYTYDKKPTLAGRKIIPLDQVESSIEAIESFCTAHGCKLSGFCVL